MNDLYQKMTNKILEGITKYNKGGSNFIFKQILGLEIYTVQYEPLGGSSYIELPESLAKKKAVINLINKEDEKCFMWAVTRALHPAKDHSERIDPKLKKATENFNWDGVTFPVELKQIDVFEKQNPTISVNVFGYEKEKVTILRKSETYKRENIVDLLLISKGEVQHYCVIKNLSRLISSRAKLCTSLLGLRDKLYFYKMYEGHEAKKCKGVKQSVVKKEITFEYYKTYLLGNLTDEKWMRTMNVIRSHRHDVYNRASQ